MDEQACEDKPTPISVDEASQIREAVCAAVAAGQCDSPDWLAGSMIDAFRRINAAVALESSPASETRVPARDLGLKTQADAFLEAQGCVKVPETESRPR
jgi:hypothetical protein